MFNLVYSNNFPVQSNTMEFIELHVLTALDFHATATRT